MANYDGILGIVDEEDPISNDVRECIDRFLLLPKEEQNLYFMMYDNGIEYTEKKDEFGKVNPYSLSEWIKTALNHIKGFNSDDCTNYALSKSVANIESFKIIDEKKKEKKIKEGIKFITNTADRVPIFTDEEHNRTVYSDGSIIDNTTGKEIPTSEFVNKVKEINDSIENKPEYNAKDKKDFDFMKRKAENEYPKTMTYVIKSNDGSFKYATELIESAEQEERFLADHKDNLISKVENRDISEVKIPDSAPINTNISKEEIKDLEVLQEKINIPDGYPITTNTPDYIEEDRPLSWDETFMTVAEVFAKRSKDPSTKVGCCIVRDNHIISTGYNGMPITEEGIDNDEVYPWERSEDFAESKYSYVVHAELNTILSSPVSVKGATLYCTLFPCNECAKAIVNSGIKEVVYKSKRSEVMYDVATKMMKNKGIILRQI